MSPTHPTSSRKHGCPSGRLKSSTALSDIWVWISIIRELRNKINHTEISVTIQREIFLQNQTQHLWTSNCHNLSHNCSNLSLNIAIPIIFRVNVHVFICHCTTQGCTMKCKSLPLYATIEKLITTLTTGKPICTVKNWSRWFGIFN